MLTPPGSEWASYLTVYLPVTEAVTTQFPKTCVSLRDEASRRGGPKESRMLDTFAFDICLISFHSYPNLTVNFWKAETLLVSKLYIQALPLNNSLRKILLY